MAKGKKPKQQKTAEPAGAGVEFLEKTKHKSLPVSDQQRGMPQPVLELPADEAKRVFALPAPGAIGSEIKRVIDRRSSVRAYQDAPISQEQLAYLLWCTQGVKEACGRKHTLRTVPSAGARHALETIILVNRVEGLAPGLYRYRALDHKLEEFQISETVAFQLTEVCFGQAMVENSAATFFWVAVVERMAWRYGERGFRYLFLDAGHVCQNLYLAAEAIDCGVCAIAAYDDDALNATLGLDGRRQFVVYLATVGKKIVKVG